MTTIPKIIAVEVTTVLRVAPDQERQRLALHFKGASLARLLSMVDAVEAGDFYQGAKVYYKECNREEREAVGLGMSAIFEGVGERETNKMLWAEREPGQAQVVTPERVIDGSTLDYPRYTLVEASKVGLAAVLETGPGL